MPLPRFTEVARVRPVALVQPGTRAAGAPYAAAQGPAPELRGTDDRGTELLVRARREGRGGRRVVLDVDRDGTARTHRSRRHGRAGEVDDLAVTVTGPQTTAWSLADGVWTARAQAPLGPARPTDLDAGDGVTCVGGFGQLGLRDLRPVTHADGTPYRTSGDDATLCWLTATSAGPGGFRTGHTSVWTLEPDTGDLRHRADLFFRDRVDGPVLGHHATHLVRDGGRWLVATSTWGTFDRRRRPGVRVVTARSGDDLTRGRHVLTTTPLELPTAGLGSVGTWDAQLVRDGGRWLVAFVSAREFFSFHPALAAGPSLDALELVGAARDRVACEGPTLVRVDGSWRLLASDGPDEPRPRRRRYPCFDLPGPGGTLVETGRLDAAYPTNIPWPSLVPLEADDWLMVGFDGTPAGGRLLGYGTHGEVVLQRSAP